MSRVGKLPIVVGGNVKVSLSGTSLEVSGPNGVLARTFPSEVTVVYEDGKISVTPVDDTTRARAMWGLTRQLIFNMVEGVSNGFTKKLEITGVGFKAENHTNLLKLSLGYSHPILYAIPAGIKIQCEKPTLISVSGYDKELVGQVSAEIRALKKPEPYKGTGIKYEGEKIRRKEGKKK
ncbi:50S ribosomal protein L6 [Rickettsiales endosymbiont of Peranema trichophorum]|uniref:50S ribosomal protein L6 n=1 Tax=Rickettsiales endosymbiont of Peranema trichophorum TaxID=2486577 RepID=UPI0010232D98|nr:50S ribosomal protein L6 [Rickettsiales endosymbiont of Peranema trichophorum]RZI45573.1 50S ribosomal protein L6 [Rickettsiales endosymbiont of Peranema trichophorum]